MNEIPDHPYVRGQVTNNEITELDILKEKYKMAREALLLIKSEGSVAERDMANDKTAAHYWRHIALERRGLASRTLDRIDRLWPTT